MDNVGVVDIYVIMWVYSNLFYYNFIMITEITIFIISAKSIRYNILMYMYVQCTYLITCIYFIWYYEPPWSDNDIHFTLICVLAQQLSTR